MRECLILPYISQRIECFIEPYENLTSFIFWLALGTAVFLCIPLIATQYSTGVTWTMGDFIFAGVIIFGTGLAYKLITRKLPDIIYRAAVGLVLASGFILIWANGAVGITGSENNLINLWYYSVILVGLAGAFVTRLKPEGMIYTMVAMAIAQALIAIAALIGGYYQIPHSSVVEVIGVNGFFITLYAVAALLFRHVAERQFY